jgi:hypothetical protein
LVPRVDEGGLTRFDSPGVGAITHYHNFTWWYKTDVAEGEELIYSSFVGRRQKTVATTTTTTTKSNDGSNKVAEESGTVKPTRLSVEYLKENGYCIDNMRPKKSRVKDAGRGAFATRDLPVGSVVAPVPMIPIRRNELMGNDPKKQPLKEQLLLNYCFANNNNNNKETKTSSLDDDWLWFPFTSVVNLINHYQEPNVKLQWSLKYNNNNNNKLIIVDEQQNSTCIDLGDNNKSSNNVMIMMELVAVKPIKEGDEIYIDYGRAWEEAWWNHVQNVWKSTTEHYTPSYVMDDAIRLLRTEQEQKEHPYPKNVFTSCFYRYSDRTEEDKTIATTSNTKDSSKLSSFRWHLTKGLYDLKNLRPCTVLKRLEDSKGRSAYAVRMLNRPGLDENEVVPKDELHIVSHVPRAAVRFSDKAGSTDQHLPYAFRREMSAAEIPPVCPIELDQ